MEWIAKLQILKCKFPSLQLFQDSSTCLRDPSPVPQQLPRIRFSQLATQMLRWVIFQIAE